MDINMDSEHPMAEILWLLFFYVLGCSVMSDSL